MRIGISQEIKEKLPFFKILAYKMDVEIFKNDDLEQEIINIENTYNNNYSLEEVINLPKIKAARDGYKALGKDPSRYRLACESLLRRLVKGNKLYRINNVVDIGNLLSIKLHRSIAVLDYQKIVGNVDVRLGTTNDEYYGIGRGLLNVENIPLYVDEISPFGSPTSDTERTAITNDTKQILLFVICFDELDIVESKKMAVTLYEKYANAKNIEELEVN